MSAQILSTKLYMPPARAQLVARPRLTARLRPLRLLTLVAAPAGFGKTTLVADWLRQKVQGQRQKVPDADETFLPSEVAWLSLEADDNDPTRFLTYFLAALQTRDPTLGQAALPLLQSPQPPSPKAILATLINDLHRQPTPFVVVLDDYHAIETDLIHEAIAFLIEHLPPHMHLVISSRADPPLPLARLRARDQMIEVRAADLRFTPEEAATFLNQTMGLALSSEQIAALEARTEGWISGLQLAALSMQGQRDVASFIAAFAGSNRFVIDYLAEEVLSRQPAHLQQFLLQTSILERMCGELCDAVLGLSEDERPKTKDESADAFVLRPSSFVDSFSQLMLEQLERANLFLIALDDARQWYRYHHLFAEVLRQRLHTGASPEAVATLHRRASLWYEQQGLVIEAVNHTLACHDWERTARLIERHGPSVAAQGQIHTVLGWLNALPPAFVSTRPLLCLRHAEMLTLTRQLAAAESRLQDAERCVQPDMPADQIHIIQGNVAMLRASIVRNFGDLAGCVALARQALDVLPDTEVVARRRARLFIGLDFLLTGDVTPATERQFEAIVAAAQTSGTMVHYLAALTNVAWVQLFQGRLRQAAKTLGQVSEVSGAAGLQIMVTSVYYDLGIGEVLREWGDFAAAERHLTQSINMSMDAPTADVNAALFGSIGLSRLKQARGDSAGALEVLDRFMEFGRQRTIVPWLFATAAAAQAQLALAQGRLDAAIDWAEASGLQTDGELPYLRELEYLTLARVWIAQGRNKQPGSDRRTGHQLDNALGLLARLLQNAEAGARMGKVIEILSLRALTLHAQGHTSEALAALERALRLAEPEGFMRTFVDEGAPMAALLQDARARGIMPLYVDKLLAAFPIDVLRVTSNELRQPSPPVTRHSSLVTLVEPLTDRELQVLLLIAAGASNQAIADKLVITIHTVKKHAGIIFGKLGVTSRTEAVARARELSIL